MKGRLTFSKLSLQGIQYFLEKDILSDKEHRTIARFLMTTDGLSKAAIGEYLGEGQVPDFLYIRFSN
jgi:brefeldin A-inhibited guanine nucleotide-exchange protein